MKLEYTVCDNEHRSMIALFMTMAFLACIILAIASCGQPSVTTTITDVENQCGIVFPTGSRVVADYVGQRDGPYKEILIACPSSFVWPMDIVDVDKIIDMKIEVILKMITSIDKTIVVNKPKRAQSAGYEISGKEINIDVLEGENMTYIIIRIFG